MGSPNTPERHIDLQQKYINTRWNQLYELEKEWGKEGIKYLILLNSGGAVATLSFIGAKSEVGAHWSVVLSLGIFFLGVVLAGLMVAVAYETVSWLHREWINDVDIFYKGKLTYDQLIEHDINRVPSGKLDRFLGYGSFVAFVFGAVIGAIGILASQ